VSKTRHAAAHDAGRCGAGPLRLALQLVFCVGSWGCVYFNTFYNAEKYYAEGERLARSGEEEAVLGDAEVALPPQARTAFEKSIEKSSAVLAAHAGTSYTDDALLLLGKAHLWLGNYTEGATALKALIDTQSESDLRREAMLWLVRASRKSGDAQTAARVGEELLASGELEGADRVQLQLELAEAALALEDPERAIAIYEQIQKSQPQLARQSDVELLIARARLQTGDHAGAIQTIRAFLAKRDAPRRQQRAALEMATALDAAGRSEEAREAYRELLEASVSDSLAAHAHFALGASHQSSGEAERAIEEFGSVARLMPASPLASAALYRRGLLEWRGLKARSTAKKSFLEAYLQDPQAPHSDSAVASARVIQEIEHYERILSGDQEVPAPIPAEEVRATAMYLLAELLYTQENDVEGARALFTSMLERHPGSAWSPKVLYTLGWLAEQEGGALPVDARAYYQRLVSEFPATEYGSYARERLDRAESRSGESSGAADLDPAGLEAPDETSPLSAGNAEGAGGLDPEGRTIATGTAGSGPVAEPLDPKLLALSRALPSAPDPLLGVQDRLMARRGGRAEDRVRGGEREGPSRADIERAREALENAELEGDSLARRIGGDSLAGVQERQAGADSLRGGEGTLPSESGEPADSSGQLADEDERI
jgi:TolA-binding protein